MTTQNGGAFATTPKHGRTPLTLMKQYARRNTAGTPKLSSTDHGNRSRPLTFDQPKKPAKALCSTWNAKECAVYERS